MNKKPLPLSQLFIAFMIATFGLLILTCVIFLFNSKQKDVYGPQGFLQFSNLVAEENSEENKHLIKINDTYGYFIDGTSISLIEYGNSVYPLCFVCGTHVPTGSVLNLPLQQDNYLFSEYPNPNKNNLYTVFDLNTLTSTDVPTLADFKEAKLDPTKAHTITLEDATNAGPELSLQKESCLIITVAELIVLISTGLLAGIFIIKEKHQRKKEAHQA